MTRIWLGSFAFLTSAILAVTASSQPPEGKKDGPDGKGPPPRFAVGKLFPPHVLEELNLTDEQQKKIDELEKKVRAELEKILTAEQIKKAESVGPPPKKDFPEGKDGKEGKEGPEGKEGKEGKKDGPRRKKDGPEGKDGKGPPKKDDKKDD